MYVAIHTLLAYIILLLFTCNSDVTPDTVAIHEYIFDV